MKPHVTVKMRSNLATFFLPGPLCGHDACPLFLSHVVGLCPFQHFQVTARHLQQTLFEGDSTKVVQATASHLRRRLPRWFQSKANLTASCGCSKALCQANWRTLLVPPTPLHSKHRAQSPKCCHLTHIKCHCRTTTTRCLNASLRRACWRLGYGRVPQRACERAPLEGESCIRGTQGPSESFAGGPSATFSC
jgi:hypothetical protein